MHLSVHGSIEINLQINRDIHVLYRTSHSHASNYEPNFPPLIGIPQTIAVEDRLMMRTS